MTVDTDTTSKVQSPPTITGRGGSATQYRELPAAVWRFEVGEPKVRQIYSELHKKWSTMIDFPLTLTAPEKARLSAEYGDPPEGILQSWRSAFGGYSVGWTLNEAQGGKESNCVAFMAACFGQKNAPDFRKWVKAGGCPTITATDLAGQIAQLEEWLRWVEGAEVFGTIRHDAGNTGGILARFGGPMAVGSLPGQPEAPYQNVWRGKLRAMLAQEQRPEPETEDIAAAELPTPAEQAAAYTAQGEPAVEAPHDFMTCKCDDCADKLRAKAAEMFGAGAAA